jgi:hypothetical protein
MTVSYTTNVTKSRIWSLHRLILRWRGSLWKLVWYDVVVWCIGYFTLSMIYRCILSDTQRVYVEFNF